jgi:hypothetical protein
MEKARPHEENRTFKQLIVRHIAEFTSSQAHRCLLFNREIPFNEWVAHLQGYGILAFLFVIQSHVIPGVVELSAELCGKSPLIIMCLDGKMTCAFGLSRQGHGSRP